MNKILDSFRYQAVSSTGYSARAHTLPAIFENPNLEAVIFPAHTSIEHQTNQTNRQQ